MRLQELLPRAQYYEQLIETVRFGQREKQQVIQNGDRFRAGFEFEIEFPEGVIGDSEDISDLTLTDIRERDSVLVDEIESDLLNQKIDEVNEETDYWEWIELAKNYINLIKNTEHLEITFFKKKINLFNEIKEELFTRDNEINLDVYLEHRNNFIAIYEALEDIFNHSFISSIQDLETSMDKLRDKVGDGIDFASIYELSTNATAIDNIQDKFDDLNNVIDKIGGFGDEVEVTDDHEEALILLQTILNDSEFLTAIDALEQFERDFSAIQDESRIDSLIQENLVDNDDIEERVFEMIEMNDELRERLVSQKDDDPINYVKENLPSNLEQYVNNIDEESSVENGCEVITVPISSDEIEDVVKSFFDFFHEIGAETGSSTGLHINISLTDENFNKENFNLLKLFLLIEEGYVQTEFDRKLTTYAMPLKRHLSQETVIEEGVRAFIENGIDQLERFTREGITHEQKMEGINILAMSDGFNMGQNYIEIRYPGDDYLSMGSEHVTFHTFRLLYLLGVAFDDDIERENYLRALYDLWNDVCKETIEMDFSEAVKMYRRHGTVVVDERDSKIDFENLFEKLEMAERLFVDETNVSPSEIKTRDDYEELNFAAKRHIRRIWGIVRRLGVAYNNRMVPSQFFTDVKKIVRDYNAYPDSSGDVTPPYES